MKLNKAPGLSYGLLSSRLRSLSPFFLFLLPLFRVCRDSSILFEWVKHESSFVVITINRYIHSSRINSLSSSHSQLRMKGAGYLAFMDEGLSVIEMFLMYLIPKVSSS